MSFSSDIRDVTGMNTCWISALTREPVGYLLTRKNTDLIPSCANVVGASLRVNINLRPESERCCIMELNIIAKSLVEQGS